MKHIPAQNQIICSNNGSLFNYSAWPSVARLPDGTLAMVCSSFRTAHVDPFGKGVICYSRDEGAHWTAPTPIVDTLQDDRDCGILVCNGKVMVNTFNNGIRHSRAITPVGSPRMALFEAYYDTIEPLADDADQRLYGSLYVLSDDGYRFGPIHRSPIQSPHGPCLLPDGKRLFIGIPMVLNQPIDWHLDCYTIDGQEQFTYLSSIFPEEGQKFCEPHAIAVDGRIILHIREEHTFRVFQCESADGGLTWTKPHPLVSHGSPPHLLRHSNGTLISVYGYRREPYGQRVMFSRDNGATWDTDYILRDDGPDGDLGYPATVELSDGSLLTVYYQKACADSPCVIMQSIWQLPEAYR